MRRNFLTKCNGRIRHRFTMHARLWYQNLCSCCTFINRVLRHRAYEILSSGKCYCRYHPPIDKSLMLSFHQFNNHPSKRLNINITRFKTWFQISLTKHFFIYQSRQIIEGRLEKFRSKFTRSCARFGKRTWRYRGQKLASVSFPFRRNTFDSNYRCSCIRSPIRLVSV